MPAPSPDHITVLHCADVPGYLTVHASGPGGPPLATAFRSGGPGAASPGPGEVTISAPAPCPAGSRRLLLPADGPAHGYLEYRWHLSLARCVIALVADDDRGVLAWTRERRALAAARFGLHLTRTLPAMAVMIGQAERGSIDPIAGGHILSWHGVKRLPRREAMLLAIAPVLGPRA